MTDDSQAPVEHRRLIIAGTGISGLSAAIYAARSNNDPLVFEGDEPGGQLTLTTDVENYPGFPDGISGPELINNMKQQAKKFGAETKNGIIESVTVSGDGADRTFHVELKNGDVYTADAFITASGASARTLDIPGQEEMMGYGLSTCATCDGAFFRDEKIMVIGGGDAAMEEANFLTKFASTVYLVHRREEFRAEDVWIDRTMEKVAAGEIELLLNTEATALHGSREDGMKSVTLVRHPDGHPTAKIDDPETEEFEFDVGAVFYAIGHTPNTDYLSDLPVETDEDGYLITEGGRGAGQTKTGVPGLFGAGDVVDFYYQQAVTAAGMGSEAAIDADEYLEALERERAKAEAGETAVAQSDD
ncbi:NAD(P)/FAD-dependent oxidoreductase [Natronocalculus amylovorans]|uniref:FAD-dependent oxidoreductase n=1 Tax=Natronocalculus amylovorans TaxID=2917812 RepID=A0AAE3G067_9EURY|nr:FAD-dependent oxidoreductase [Natronocalculus amylovorans]MCL9818415.1 FAD-dependent oxidoreductase [Natronocalculus amylovorans]